MSLLSTLLTLKCSCDRALQWSSQNLQKYGLRVVQTFDLQTVHRHVADCPCPYHGTNACDCQMLVLLVYGEAAEPVTLILHGNDGRTWFSIPETPNQKTDRKTAGVIRGILGGYAPD